MQIALVHDYLKEYGGAERVLEALHQMFPQAPVFVAIYNRQGLGIHAARFKGWDIRTSVMQQIPFITQLLSPLKFLSPLAFESFDLRSFDLVISSSSAYFSKAVITQPNCLHINYVHTPPRYLYGYTVSSSYQKNIISRVLGGLLNHFMRLWDFELSQRPDILVANSENIRKRISKFYRRDSVVIYPPVQAVSTKGDKKEYFLSLGRLDRGKGVNLVVAACNQLRLPLKVVGAGREEESLKKAAGATVHFLGAVSEEEKFKLYAGAKALILAAEDEDFGITSVEAQATGTPVVALRVGGYLETVIENKTGVFFGPEAHQPMADDKALVESLTAVLKEFDPTKFKAEDCQENAQKFSKARFKKEMLDLIDRQLKKV